jgi:PKD repeat protein
LAPEISIAGSSFSITEGDEFTAAYEVTGAEPITVTVKATRADGSAAAGFSADQNARRINAPSNLAPGTYRVTVTAKNASGEDSASFTLTVSAKPVTGTAPRISFSGSSFKSIQGEKFSTEYELSGTEPITITINAANAEGTRVGGFSADQNVRRINAPSNLAPGTYRVTVTAKNASGEDSASFTLTVSAKPVTGTAPRISFSGSSFKSIQGEKFSTEYELSGTEPITITINAATDSGSAAKGFSLDQAARKVNAPSNLVPGTYRVTVTAKNAVGEDSATFTLTVSAKPVIGTAPRISFDGDSFKSTQGDEFNTIYELTGTEPITVKVNAATADGSAVKGFSVDQSASLVKGDPDLEAGTYHVTVTAKNAAGEDSASFTLTVKAKAVPQQFNLFVYFHFFSLLHARLLQLSKIYFSTF